MKNIFLVFLGGLLLSIVAADWNVATWQVNAMLVVIGLAALGVGILSGRELSLPGKPVFMASHVDGIPSPRTKVRT